MDEAWGEFMVSGKVTDYLRYKSGTSDQTRMTAETGAGKERPDGTEYCSDRDGIKCNADWRL